MLITSGLLCLSFTRRPGERSCIFDCQATCSSRRRPGQVPAATVGDAQVSAAVDNPPGKRTINCRRQEWPPRGGSGAGATGPSRGCARSRTLVSLDAIGGSVGRLGEAAGRRSAVRLRSVNEKPVLRCLRRLATDAEWRPIRGCWIAPSAELSKPTVTDDWQGTYLPLLPAMTTQLGEESARPSNGSQAIHTWRGSRSGEGVEY
jgi:hypothetical protein